MIVLSEAGDGRNGSSIATDGDVVFVRPMMLIPHATENSAKRRGWEGAKLIVYATGALRESAETAPGRLLHRIFNCAFDP